MIKGSCLSEHGSKFAQHLPIKYCAMKCIPMLISNEFHSILSQEKLIVFNVDLVCKLHIQITVTSCNCNLPIVGGHLGRICPSPVNQKYFIIYYFHLIATNSKTHGRFLRSVMSIFV